MQWTKNNKFLLNLECTNLVPLAMSRIFFLRLKIDVEELTFFAEIFVFREFIGEDKDVRFDANLLWEISRSSPDILITELDNLFVEGLELSMVSVDVDWDYIVMIESTSNVRETVNVVERVEVSLDPTLELLVLVGWYN